MPPLMNPANVIRTNTMDVSNREGAWFSSVAEEQRKRREALGLRKPVVPALATQTPQQATTPVTPISRIWGAPPMPQGLPRPRVEGPDLTTRFANWAGIQPSSQAPVTPPVTPASTSVPVAPQPSLTTTQVQPITDTPEQTNTVTMPPRVGEKGWANANLKPGQYVAYGVDPRTAETKPMYVPSTLTTNLDLKGPARTTAFLNDINRPKIQEPSFATAEQRPQKFAMPGTMEKFNEQTRQNRIAMGIAGPAEARTPDEKKALFEKRWNMTHSSGERRGIERSLADIATKEAREASLASQEVGWKRNDLLTKQAQDNAIAQIKARGEAQAGIYGAKQAAKAEAVAGKLTTGEKVAPFVAASDLFATIDPVTGKDVTTADQRKVFNDNVLNKGMSIYEAGQAAKLNLKTQQPGVIFTKDQIRQGKQVWDKAQGKFVDSVVPAVVQGTTPATGQTTQFKAGDIQTKNGIKYQRDANGNWNPV